MNTIYYQKYKESILTLAKTLVIKSDDVAAAINQLLVLKFGPTVVDALSPATWKYYLNISGQYHVTDLADIHLLNNNLGISSNKITIKSLDTALDITLDDYTTLDSHPNTKIAYSYGSRYYDALVSRYPNHRQLIFGILYPANIDLAISSANGTILSFKSDLVEPQENTLMRDVGSWIKSMYLAYHVDAFKITDSLYTATQHAVIYLYLPIIITNLRLRRCKSNETHSFHVRTYLAGYGELDKYIPYLTTTQSMWLYRNIDRIIKYGGSKDTLDWLVKNILTNRNIPLDSLTAYQQEGFDVNGYSNYAFITKPVSMLGNLNTVREVNLDQIVAKENALAPNNLEYNNKMKSAIGDSFKDSTAGVRLTKVLDSDMIDHVDETRYTLPDILFNNWGYMASMGTYTGMINYKNPITNDTVVISVADAYIYVTYLTIKALGRSILTMPDLSCTHIPRPKPIQVTTLYPASANINVKQTIDNVYSSSANIGVARSTAMFYRMGVAIYSDRHYQESIVALQEDPVDRVLLEIAADKLYMDTLIKFRDTAGNPIQFNQWLPTTTITDTVYTPLEAIQIINAVTMAATGYQIDPTTRIKNVQASLISLMRELSSYSVQYTTSINSSGIKPVRWAVIRAKDKKIHGWARQHTPIPDSIVNTLNSISKFKLAHDVSQPYLTAANGSAMSSKTSNTIKVSTDSVFTALKTGTKLNTHYVVPTGRLSVNLNYLAYNPAINNTGMAGYETWIALSSAQQSTILSIY